MLTRQFQRFYRQWPFVLPTLLAYVAGCATTLAFAPINIASMAILAPALLIILWDKASPKRAFWLGFAYGFGFFSTSVWWVVVSLHEHGQLPLALAWLLAALFFAYLALFPALTGWLGVRFFKLNNILFPCLVLPCIWIVTEWLRGTLFTGFPWMLLGYSQTDSWLRGLAPIIGSYGLSFICLILAGAIAYAITHRNLKTWLLTTIVAITIFTTSYSLTWLQWTTPKHTPLSISLIQGNISQAQKWDQTEFFNTLDHYFQLTRKELGRDLIILPESALPVPDWYITDYLEKIDNLAKQAKSIVIIGIPSQTEAMQNNETYFNALQVFGTDKVQYFKRHLVPFGEYLSFLHSFDFILDYLHIPMASFIHGPQHIQPFILKNLSIEPLICYEIAYSALVYDNLPDAEIILLVNDDSWFGDSAAADQHLQIARMRALETRRYIIFESNTGITAIINPFGKIIAEIPINKVAVLRDTIDGMQGQTPIIIWGDSLILIICLACLVAIFCYRRKRT